MKEVTGSLSEGRISVELEPNSDAVTVKLPAVDCKYVLTTELELNPETVTSPTATADTKFEGRPSATLSPAESVAA